MVEIVYFELNNWFSGRDYPDDEPFISWMYDDLKIAFDNKEWVKSNKLCVVSDIVDMSSNYCITATKEWVEQNCPKLLTDYKSFIREENQQGEVYGRFGHKFLSYSDENIGVTEVDLGL